MLGKKGTPEYYLALLLHDEKVHAVVFEQHEKTVRIVGKHKEPIETSLERAPVDEWLDILDKTISRAEETLPQGVQTEKTIFGVKDDWIEDKKIKKEYLTTLKKVCDSLSLKPIGFLVLSEAITHLLQEEEGAPVSALLAQIGKKGVTVSLIRAGHVLQTRYLAMDGTPVESVDAALKRFTDVEVFPARIIIANGEDDLGQEFVAHQWSKSLPFLHVPQISVLPDGFAARAVVFGAATQMGFAPVGAILEKDAGDIKTYTGTTRSRKTDEADEEDRESAGDAAGEEVGEAAGATGQREAAAFGFVLDADIDKTTEEAKTDEEETGKEAEKGATDGDEEKDNLRAKDHSEHVDEEAAYAFRREEHDNLRPVPKNNEEEDEENEDGDEEEAPQRSRFSMPSGRGRFALSGLLSGIKGVFSALPFGKIINSASSTIHGGGKFIFIAPVVILALVGIVLLYVFQMRATITLAVTPRPIEQERTISFSLTDENDFAQNTIQAKTVTIDLSGKTTTKATGKKEIGEEAKGTVTLYNSSDSRRTLEAGTVITSSNNLIFTLDKDVSVGSASGDIFTGTKPGTADVAVTASKIGNEYNLPSNTKFSVSGTSTVAARNEKAFSGGSKKEVTVISRNDVNKLNTDLPRSLQDQAKEELTKQIDTTEELLPVFSEAMLANRKLSKREGDEAQDVTLDATVTFTYFAYSKKDLEEYAMEIVKQEYTDSDAISGTGIKTALSDVKQNGEKDVTSKITISGGLMPRLDVTKLQKDLAGKPFTEAEEMLRKLPQISDSQISLSPPIPFLPKTLPRLGNNISVSIKTNE